MSQICALAPDESLVPVKGPNNPFVQWWKVWWKNCRWWLRTWICWLLSASFNARCETKIYCIYLSRPMKDRLKVNKMLVEWLYSSFTLLHHSDLNWNQTALRVTHCRTKPVLLTAEILWTRGWGRVFALFSTTLPHHKHTWSLLVDLGCMVVSSIPRHIQPVIDMKVNVWLVLLNLDLLHRLNSFQPEQNRVVWNGTTCLRNIALYIIIFILL